MKIIISGSRTFTNFKLLCKVMDHYVARLKKVEIITGGAKGADKLGQRWALANWYSVRNFYPDYTKYGKEASLKRNKEMAQEGDVLIAFHNGWSPGTRHMISTAKFYGLIVKVIKFKE